MADPGLLQDGYTECFVAFIDVLGFRQTVHKAGNDPGLLKKLVSATSFATHMTGGTKESRRINPDGSVELKQWKIQIRAFSDSVVIFMPVEAGSLPQVLFLIRYLHDRLLELNLCMRGAVTIGGMYWDDDWSDEHNAAEQPDDEQEVIYDRNDLTTNGITLGPGMMEAYDLESKEAIYPRILLTGPVLEYMRVNNVTCIPFGPYKPADRLMLDYVRQDGDGKHHLDLLHPEVMRSDTERIVRRNDVGNFYVTWERDECDQARILGYVHSICNSYLDEPTSDRRVLEKYEWLRTYAEDSVA